MYHQTLGTEQCGPLKSKSRISGPISDCIDRIFIASPQPAAADWIKYDCTQLQQRHFRSNFCSLQLQRAIQWVSWLVFAEEVFSLFLCLVFVQEMYGDEAVNIHTRAFRAVQWIHIFSLSGAWAVRPIQYSQVLNWIWVLDGFKWI